MQTRTKPNTFFPSAPPISVPDLPSLDGIFALFRDLFLKQFKDTDVSSKGASIKLRSVSIDKVAAELSLFEVHSFGGSRWERNGATREDICGEDPRRRGGGELLSERREHLHPPRRKGQGGGVCWGDQRPKSPMASGGRSGFQRDPSVDWSYQARVWSHAVATTSPRCTFAWFSSRVGELEAPMVALEEGVAPISKTDMIMRMMKLSKTTAPMSLDVVGECYEKLKISVAFSFLYIMFPLMQSSLLFIGLLRVVLWCSSLERCLLRASIL